MVQLLAHVSGGAGTGKSYIIQCLNQLFDSDELRLSAYTGSAAFQIFGKTTCSEFRLPRDASSFEPLSDNVQRELQERFRRTLVFVIDEKSMIGLRHLGMIDSRLREVFPEKADVIFGGASVVLFGDFGQLPPVGDRALFQRAAPHDELSIKGKIAYREFKQSVVLKKSVRQEDDPQFAALLARMRDGVALVSDYNLLATRFKGKGHTLEQLRTTFRNCAHLFATNAKTEEFNARKLYDLNKPVAVIKAVHTGGRSAARAKRKVASNLFAELALAEGAVVMLTSNEWTEAGLTNGSVGTVVGIDYAEGTGPPSLPNAVFVHFDNYIGPSCLPAMDRVVAIRPVRGTWSAGGRQLSRKQLPLMLAWAFTIHKSQGWTFLYVVIDIGDREFATGLSYVAISRSPKLSSLILAPFSLARFKRCVTSKYLAQRIREERRIARMSSDAPVPLTRRNVNRDTVNTAARGRGRGRGGQGGDGGEGNGRGRGAARGRGRGGTQGGDGGEGNGRGRGAARGRGRGRGSQGGDGGEGNGRGRGAARGRGRGRGSQGGDGGEGNGRGRGAARGRGRGRGSQGGDGGEGNGRGRGAARGRGRGRGNQSGAGGSSSGSATGAQRGAGGRGRGRGRGAARGSGHAQVAHHEGLRRGPVMETENQQVQFQFNFLQHKYCSSLTVLGIPISNYTMHNIVGDGNCLFRSLAHFLYGDQSYHAEVRSKLVRFAKSNYAPSTLLGDFGFVGYASYSDYLDDTTHRTNGLRLKDNYAYGVFSDVQLFTTLTHIPVHVISRGTRDDGNHTYEMLREDVYNVHDTINYAIDPRPETFPPFLQFPQHDNLHIVIWYNGHNHFEVLTLQQ